MQAKIYSIWGEPLVTTEASPSAQKLEVPKLDVRLALWMILFVFGGGLLALYYAGIGYFPEVTWQDTLTYLALMTIIGGSLFVAYGFLLFMPGAIWSEFLIYEVQFSRVLKMERGQEPCVWSVTKRLLFPFAVFMAFCHFLLFQEGPSGLVPAGAAASLIALSGLLGRDLRDGLRNGRKKDSLLRHRVLIGTSHIPLFAAFVREAYFESKASATFLWIAALLPLVGLLACSWPKDPAGECEPPVPDQWSLLCRATLAFGSAALVSLGALWFFHSIYRGGVRGTAPLTLLWLCTLVVIVTNLVVSVLFHEHRRRALLASFLAALLLLGAGQLLGPKGGKLPEKIMEKFGFGGQSGTLVLTEKGGRLLVQQAIPVEFEEQARPEAIAAGDLNTKEEKSGGSGKAAEGKPREERLARVVGVTILSRLGSEYLLRFGERTVTLPKTEVVSWSAVLPEVGRTFPDRGVSLPAVRKASPEAGLPSPGFGTPPSTGMEPEASRRWAVHQRLPSL